MANYFLSVVNGEVRLNEGVTSEMIAPLFVEANGDWSVEPGELTYSFWNEGYRCTIGPDHRAILDRLVELGYNSAAWREEYSGSSENGGAYSGNELRGTPEQKRKLRLEEIDQQLAALERERQELLVT